MLHEESVLLRAPMKPGLELFQRWGTHDFSGEPILVLSAVAFFPTEIPASGLCLEFKREALVSIFGLYSLDLGSV